jgi:hypothetical protein
VLVAAVVPALRSRGDEETMRSIARRFGAAASFGVKLTYG